MLQRAELSGFDRLFGFGRPRPLSGVANQPDLSQFAPELDNVSRGGQFT